jgi:hypothetical protein
LGLDGCESWKTTGGDYGEAGMSAGEVKYWEPRESGELRGAFDFYEGTHWAVRTEDGTVWLLGPHAEEALRAKRPGEGDQVQITHMLDVDVSRQHRLAETAQTPSSSGAQEE